MSDTLTALTPFYAKNVGCDIDLVKYNETGMSYLKLRAQYVSEAFVGPSLGTITLGGKNYNTYQNMIGSAVLDKNSTFYVTKDGNYVGYGKTSVNYELYAVTEYHFSDSDLVIDEEKHINRVNCEFGEENYWVEVQSGKYIQVFVEQYSSYKFWASINSQASNVSNNMVINVNPLDDLNDYFTWKGQAFTLNNIYSACWINKPSSSGDIISGASTSNLRTYTLLPQQLESNGFDISGININNVISAYEPDGDKTSLITSTTEGAVIKTGNYVNVLYPENSNVLNWTINVNNYASKTYRLKPKNHNPLYLGQDCKEDLRDKFSLVYRLESTNYYYIENIINNSLSVSSIKTDYLTGEFDQSGNLADDGMPEIIYTYSGSDLTLSLDESIIGRDYTADIHYINGANTLVLNLASFVVKKGATFILPDGMFDDLLQARYDDGTIHSISNVIDGTANYSCNLPYEEDENLNKIYNVGTNTTSFVITASAKLISGITNASNNTISGTYTVIVSDEYDEEYELIAELEGAKSSFNPTEILNIGTTAVLNTYNNDGNVVNTYSGSELNSVISTADSNYNKKVSGVYYKDAFNTVIFNYRHLTFNWQFVVDYSESVLKIDTSSMQVSYFVGGKYGNNVVLNTTGLIIQEVIHKNSEELKKIENETILPNSVTFDLPSGNITSDEELKICNVSYVNKWNQTLTGTFNLKYVKYKYLSLDIDNEDTKTYYSNDSDTFHLPVGVTYTVICNDNDNITLDSEDIAKLEYYRDENHMNKLTVGETIIKESDGNVIYVYDPSTETEGQYNITFIPDTIASVDLKDNVNLVLGNTPSKFKTSMVVQVNYISGRTVETIDYEFIDNSVMMASRDIQIKYQGETFTLTSSKITFVKPVIESISLDTSNFKLLYNNTSDEIDCSTLKATVYYENSDYSEVCLFHNENTIDGDNQFIVSSTDLVDFKFDGTQVVDIDMESLTSKDVNLTITVRNKFDNTQTDTTTLTLSIVEIVDITGIAIKKIYNEYHLGESFLNDNDDTTIVVYFKNTENKLSKVEMLLKDALSSLNIYPYKGTVFNAVDKNKTVTIKSATNSNVVAEYNIQVSANYNYSDRSTKRLVAVHVNSFVYEGTNYFDKYLLVSDVDEEGNNNTVIDSVTGERVLASGKTLSSIKKYGYLEDIFDTSKSARVILFEDYIPPIDGQNNITVTYPCYDDKNADKINKCHFGILFGNNNARNRLFVSGNPDVPNCDWHSGEIDSNYVEDTNMVNGNLGYFEDLSYCYYGETDNEVIGYDIVSNDKLLVLKNYSDKETTVYFRTPVLVTAINGSGTQVSGVNGETLYQEEFSLSKGNNSVAGISNKSIVNFNGDTLFLSHDKSLCGLDLTGIIGDNQRYANSRSYYIDKDLMNYDLSNALVWTDNNYLLICLADKTYLTHYQTLSNSQYEWWVMDVKDVQAIVKLDNQLYFGDSNGHFKTFTNGFDDIDKIFIGEGESMPITIGETSDTIQVTEELINQISESYDEANPCKFEVNNNYEDDRAIFYQLAYASNDEESYSDLFIDAENNCFVLKDSDNYYSILTSIIEDKAIYINHLEGENDIGCYVGDPIGTYYKKYYLRKFISDSVTMFNDAYKLYDYETNEEVSIANLYRCGLCYRLDDEYDVINIDNENATFQLSLNGKLVNLVRYASQSIVRSFSGVIKKYHPVEAYFVTKPFDFGSLSSLKTIWSITLSNDTNIPSELEVSYISNKIPTNNSKSLAFIPISKDLMGLDFEEMSFRAFDLDKNLVPRTYTTQRTLGFVKYLTFAFKNYNSTNSVLTSIEVIYTTPYPSYGSD